SCGWDEAETTGMATPLHARLVLDFGAHEPGEKTDVEAAHLGIVLRKIVIDAVLALDARQFLRAAGRERARDEARLVHDLDDLVDALGAVQADEARDETGGEFHAQVVHV